jgi:hypothetical protein
MNTISTLATIALDTAEVVGHFARALRSSWG